jgi:hypothetical protein
MKKLAIALSLTVAFGAQAASTTGQALVEVLSAISIVKDSDLDFGQVYQGDPSGSIAPSDGGASQFTVSGSPSTAYSITLPADGTVIMITGGGGANETIGVNSFSSLPAAGAGTGLLDGAGQQIITVGATYDAIGAAQVAGLYAASFTVDVVY